MAFDRNEEGELVAAFDPRMFESEGRAEAEARILSGKHGGVIAWSRKADPDLGDYGEPPSWRGMATCRTWSSGQRHGKKRLFIESGVKDVAFFTQFGFYGRRLSSRPAESAFYFSAALNVMLNTAMPFSSGAPLNASSKVSGCRNPRIFRLTRSWMVSF